MSDRCGVVTIEASSVTGTDTDTDEAVLQEVSAASEFAVYRSTGSTPRGLTEQEADERLAQWGENVSQRDPLPVFSYRLLAAMRSPFVALLGSLGVVFGVLGDAHGAVTVAIMVVSAASLRTWQHGRAERAVASLCTSEPATATVRRRCDDDAASVKREVPVTEVVVGDVVALEAGDVVPGDVRIISSSGLAIDQSMLTGETLPVGKAARTEQPLPAPTVVACPRLCFAGATVVEGTATGIVVGTGSRTYSGSLRSNASRHDRQSSVDRGVRAVGWTLVRLMLGMATVVFLVRGACDGQWTHAAILAVAVAVGLTPEMLPVIVTTTLARGATRLAARNVIVKRLDGIQDLGAMEVLCFDKTGTLTEDRVVYAHAVDASGHLDGLAAELAVVAAECSDATAGRFEDAIAFVAEQAADDLGQRWRLIDEVSFDHSRRRASVVVTNAASGHKIICQGDADTVLMCCATMRVAGTVVEMDAPRRAAVGDIVAGYRSAGMQVLAVAVRDAPARLGRYSATDECGLTLAGYVVFVDPVRVDAPQVVGELARLGVSLKMVTGDARTVAAHVAAQVGIATDAVLVGDDLERLDDGALRAAVPGVSIFAEVTPAQKGRIVAALRAKGMAVGFVGDGVNDLAALRLSDVGIAADTATGAAKQAADLIMLNRDLRVIADGVVEGRRTLGNTMKYVRITASSNFGNAVSVLFAGLLLPILPILPVQLLVQNLLYDAAQLALPWDRVDPGYLSAPRRWRSDGLIRFMATFGVLSSLFDVATFAALWWWFGGAHSPALFQTGWFLEGLLSQLMIVMVLRGRAAPWKAPCPATVMVLAGCLAAGLGVALPASPLARVLRFQLLPITYALWLIGVLIAYAAIAYLVKRRYVRHVDGVP
jgi:Mg2+-importing ATPase